MAQRVLLRMVRRRRELGRGAVDIKVEVIPEAAVDIREEAPTVRAARRIFSKC